MKIPEYVNEGHEPSSDPPASERQQLQDQVSVDLVLSEDSDEGTTHLVLSLLWSGCGAVRKEKVHQLLMRMNKIATL